MTSSSRSKFDYLVIGCGYVGLRAARKWSAAGGRVAVTTRSADRAAEFRRYGWTLFECDVTQPESLDSLPEANATLYCVGYDRSAEPSLRSVYVDGYAAALSRLQSRTNRLVSISSTSVYGQTDGSIVDESSVCEPERENGQICLEAEELTQASPLSAVTLRLAGIYGPNRLLARIQERKAEKPLGGNPDAWLNLIHVADAVAAIDAALKHPAPQKCYLVADEQPITRREYYESLCRLIGAPAPIFDSNISDRKGDRGLNKRCRNKLLKQELLQHLQFPTIAEGLPDAISGDSDGL